MLYSDRYNIWNTNGLPSRIKYDYIVTRCVNVTFVVKQYSTADRSDWSDFVFVIEIYVLLVCETTTSWTTKNRQEKSTISCCAPVLCITDHDRRKLFPISECNIHCHCFQCSRRYNVQTHSSSSVLNSIRTHIRKRTRPHTHTHTTWHSPKQLMREYNILIFEIPK